MSPDTLAPNPVGWKLAAAALVALAAALFVFWLLDPKQPIIGGLKTYFSTDKTFGYAPRKLFGMLRDYHEQAGEENKQKYFDAHRAFIKADFVFALVYTAASVVLILYLYGALAPHVPAWFRYLWLVPLVVGVTDILEGVSMWFILDAYRSGPPANPPRALALFSSAMTSVKLVFMCVLIGLLLAGGGAFVFKKLGRL